MPCCCPGVNALERFSFARKFQLLALLFLLPLCYAAWSIGDNHLGKLGWSTTTRPASCSCRR